MPERKQPKPSTSEVMEEIKLLQRQVAESVALRHLLERNLRSARVLLYVVLALNLALFGFLIGALFKYIS